MTEPMPCCRVLPHFDGVETLLRPAVSSVWHEIKAKWSPLHRFFVMRLLLKSLIESVKNILGLNSNKLLLWSVVQRHKREHIQSHQCRFNGSLPAH